MSYQYQLNSAKKYACPSCGKSGRFARYLDTESGEYLGDDIGKCDRVENCKYHKTPKDYFAENGQKQSRPTKPKPLPAKPTSYINQAEVTKTLERYDQSTFYKLLVKQFGDESANKIANDYLLGAVGQAVVFWQIDTETKIRTGKAMNFSNDFHRVKNDAPKWMHKKYSDFVLKQCLFGSHLLSIPANNNKPICIVESEKTAVIAAIVMPDRLWLATGGANNLKPASEVNKKVYLFPDKGLAEEWAEKAKQLRLTFEVSDFLEDSALDTGSDIADLILTTN